MAKTLTVFTEAGKFTAPATKKNTLVNASSTNLYLTDDETDLALSAISAEAKQAVLNSLYRVKPGEAKTLSAATYNLSFDYGYNPQAVLVTE